MFYPPQFAAHGRAKFSTSATFVSAAGLESGTFDSLKLGKRLAAVKGTRHVTKKDLVWNDATPRIEVDPETYTVRAGKRAADGPAVFFF